MLGSGHACEKPGTGRTSGPCWRSPPSWSSDRCRHSRPSGTVARGACGGTVDAAIRYPTNLYAIPILIGVCLFTFFLFYVVVSPTQLARRNLSSKNPTRQEIQDWLQQHGYDRPQSSSSAIICSNWLSSASGTRTPMASPSAKASPGDRAFSEAGRADVPAEVYVAVVLALLLAYYRGTYLDLLGLVVCVAGMSIPLLVYIIAGQFYLGKLLRLFPFAGYGSGLHSWNFIVMPMVIGVAAGIWGRFVSTGPRSLEEINQDYVRTARAKGVAEGRHSVHARPEERRDADHDLRRPGNSVSDPGQSAA